jgi:hypothetical protein
MRGRSRAGSLGVLLTVVVVAAVATGIYLIGSPSEERARRLDRKRVEHLANLTRAVDVYWIRHARIPPTLDELRKEVGDSVTTIDPGTSARYEYQPLEGAAYELCAAFERDSTEAGRLDGEMEWSHRSGRHCFRREARKP